MTSYYADRLAADRLRRCYELATPAVRRYLEAEIAHVVARIAPGDRVLDLGCGYGRVFGDLAARAGLVVGVDTALASLRAAGAEPGAATGRVLLANAVALPFRAAAFDLVVAIQNGISAFGEDQRRLLEEAVRVARPGGRVLFSSYAAAFWPERLAWFRIQAAHGLVGEIDEAATGDGIIVCRDGFRATTVGPARFRELARGLGARVTVETVAASSVFCVIAV
jgi:SAM-dependent methyltransferase